MKLLGVLACWILVTSATAQDTCSCPRNLDRYIDMVTRNYAGFHDKVKTETQGQYQVLLDSLSYAASITTDKSACFDVLDGYRAFFYDKHLQLVGLYAPHDTLHAAPPAVLSNWNATTLTAYFEERGRVLDPLEGSWRTGGYLVGIVHNDSTNRFDAIIISAENGNWKEGMVKFSMTIPEDDRSQVDYLRGDLVHVPSAAIHAAGHFSIKGVGAWHKVQPPTPGAMSDAEFEVAYNEDVQLRLLNDSTVYIKLNSCDLANKAVLESLVEQHRDALDTTPNWIVDFRDNGGGSTDVFQSLLPYLYTKPFKEYGVNHWMSPENTALLKAWCEANKAMLDKSTASQIRSWVRQGEARPNTWHVGHGSTTRYGKPKAMPERVAILADGGTASSGESFLELARGMSEKSVIFGDNTGGFMDYGDLMQYPLGCDGLEASIPTSRMNRMDHGLTFDRDGITPDVRIGEEETDWIGFVQRYWTKR